MKPDRFTKSVLIVIAALLGVIALRPSAQAQQEEERRRDLSQLQVSRLDDGRLFIFDASTGDLLEGVAGGGAGVVRIGTIRQTVEGAWEIANMKGDAGRSLRAQMTAAKTDISMLETALDAFEIDNGRYPTNEEGLAALSDAPPGLREWRGPYIRRGAPKDPWGNEYVYRFPGKNNAPFELQCFGPDGKDGGGDDFVSSDE